MSYLYGDSTPSTLEVNFIEFLRDAVDYCVQVLLADQRIVQGAARTRALDLAAVAEIERLQKAGALVPKAFEGLPPGEAGSSTANCVAAIVRSAAELVRAEIAAIHGNLDAEIVKRDAEAARDREACVKALETLLIRHDLPDMATDTQLALLAGGRYACRARVTTGFGLDAVLDLEIPAGHLYERVVRVDRLMERLDVQAPELGGWLHKEVKPRTQHLEKHHVAGFSIAGGAGTLKLRLAPDGTGPGFDVLFSREAPRVRLARAPAGEAAPEPPFDVEDADVPKLVALQGKLATAAAELARHRRALVEAKIDGELLRAHANPSLIVERLIATMAPVVQQIAARSQSPGELVLRRLLAGDRREEIFLSKRELKLKLEPLVEGNRSFFDPLWLDHVVGGPAAAGPTPPASVRRSTATYRLDQPVPPATASAAATPTHIPSPPAASTHAASPPAASASPAATPAHAASPVATPAQTASPAAAPAQTASPEAPHAPPPQTAGGPAPKEPARGEPARGEPARGGPTHEEPPAHRATMPVFSALPTTMPPLPSQISSPSATPPIPEPPAPPPPVRLRPPTPILGAGLIASSGPAASAAPSTTEPPPRREASGTIGDAQPKENGPSTRR